MMQINAVNRAFRRSKRAPPVIDFRQGAESDPFYAELKKGHAAITAGTAAVSRGRGEIPGGDITSLKYALILGDGKTYGLEIAYADEASDTATVTLTAPLIRGMGFVGRNAEKLNGVAYQIVSERARVVFKADTPEELVGRIAEVTSYSPVCRVQ